MILTRSFPPILDANHIPFLLSRDASVIGTLHSHVARAYPVWRDVVPHPGARVAGSPRPRAGADADAAAAHDGQGGDLCDDRG
ncbi:FMN-binding negative transcriptional regulator [Neoroseomonas terrae]|uniref:FMN-binding negative transcriptional regulator n=1 Tax=Neoroseomonas terrae TaxID=424799 RepID=UPI001BAB71E4